MRKCVQISTFPPLPNNMTSSFLRSTRNLSSVHSGSGRGWGPLRSSSDPGRGESVLRSLLEPWSDCCKYPLKVSHWEAIALRSNFFSGHCVGSKLSRAEAKRWTRVLTFQSRHSAMLLELIAALLSPASSAVSSSTFVFPHYTGRLLKIGTSTVVHSPEVVCRVNGRRTAHSKHTNQLLGKVSRVITQKTGLLPEILFLASTSPWVHVKSLKVGSSRRLLVAFNGTCWAHNFYASLLGKWFMIKTQHDTKYNHQLWENIHFNFSWSVNKVTVTKGLCAISSVKLSVYNNSPCDQFIGLQRKHSTSREWILGSNTGSRKWNNLLLKRCHLAQQFW